MKFTITTLAALLLAGAVDAQWRRGRSQPSYQPAAAAFVPPRPGPGGPAGTEGDGLAEVNARRAANGYPPFIHDPNLAAGALGAARYRAQHGLFGHTPNDFQFLPPGTTAAAAGCSAYPPEMGWFSCCCEERKTFGGAAWVIGPSGLRYMHLFVK